jgi:hypothetical protein
MSSSSDTDNAECMPWFPSVVKTCWSWQLMERSYLSMSFLFDRERKTSTASTALKWHPLRLEHPIAFFAKTHSLKVSTGASPKQDGWAPFDYATLSHKIREKILEYVFSQISRTILFKIPNYPSIGTCKIDTLDTPKLIKNGASNPSLSLGNAPTSAGVSNFIKRLLDRPRATMTCCVRPVCRRAIWPS